MASIVKGRRDGLKGEHLKHTSINGVDIYTITSQQRSIPSWLGNNKNQKSSRRVKQNTDVVALLQDLWFETATTKIRATPDGEYLIASGIYPPQVKVYELSQLSMKFERHLESEIIDFEILDDDYSKLAFLCTDRSICFHAKYGKHYSLRIPRMGRDITYDCWSCDLLCAASSPDVYRINLEQGQFLSSLATQSPALNVVSRSKVHGLVACGGDDGYVECFDIRTKPSIGRIDAVAPAGDIDQEVTAIEFDGDGGFLMAVGSSAGKVLIYDLRSSHPLRVKDHMYDSPILDIKWHRTLNSQQPKLITSDNHIVRIWDPETGEGMTSIEPGGGRINDTCVFPGTGLILLALDSRQIPAYFIPDLGPAPKWSPRLQNWEELELEENKEAVVYDNYKFLTREDLDRLNLTNLIGTNLLIAVMHGFFIDHRLYKKAKELANPFSYDEYIEQKKQEKMEKERANRIAPKRKLPKVNRNLAQKILDNEEADSEKKDNDDKDTKKTSKKKKTLGSDIFKDERFAKMFENKDFQIDELSQEYLALHPVASTKQPSLVEEHFEPVMEEEDHDLGDSDASSTPESSDDEKNNGKKRSRVPRLHEVKDERHAEAFRNRVSLAKENSLALGERLASLENNQRASSGIPNGVKFGPGGSREISFKARRSAKYKEDEEDKEETRREKRRGVQSLGLKSNRNMFGGRGRGGHRGRGGGRGGGRAGRRGGRR
ncbi:nucleolar protein 10 isoform X2 [Morus notabilis]|uniref:nucleolar protein 10 isoform X2 n=1 Tax=Morus notabilis TaxID=981085 RepID=UPI000CED7A64|nr:nucleolar protein 10 isoform X2 [Morus notabilis]